MAGRELEGRVKRALHRPPLSGMSAAAHEELGAFLEGAQSFEDLPGKWQAALAAAEEAGSSGRHEPRQAGHCCGDHHVAP